MKIPKKIQEKLKDNDYPTFIDLSGQNSGIQNNFLKHVSEDSHYVGSLGAVYYFKFPSTESRDLFIEIIADYLTSKNIKSNVN